MLLLILALVILVWARITHKPWRELGLARPRSWFTTIVVGILSGIAFKFFMKAIVMPLLGADPVNQAYRHLTGNTAALPEMILTILISAAFGEEARVCRESSRPRSWDSCMARCSLTPATCGD